MSQRTFALDNLFQTSLREWQARWKSERTQPGGLAPNAAADEARRLTRAAAVRVIKPRRFARERLTGGHAAGLR